MAQIDAIFFYHSFLDWVDRRGDFQICCPLYGYTYLGKGGAVQAKEKIELFLEQRAEKEKADRDRQKP